MTMKKPVLLPYKLGSLSAKALSTKLAGLINKKVFRVDNQSRTYRVKPNRLYINWGSSTSPRFNATPVLNSGAAVAIASNKLATFNRFAERGVACPEFTTDLTVARQWAAERAIFARTALNGHSGRGIVECSVQSFTNAPLYTKYIPKKHEYRVHVFQGRVIDCQQKKKRRDIPNEQINYKVRSYQNGWVFCRENVQKPDGLDALAIEATAALGLDFGAVDIIYNEKGNKCYALEVNTAPGLAGQTVDSYANAIMPLLRRN
jgi:glutathione synthase/RimK-type ligase-like ATP-grasp enzyme